MLGGSLAGHFILDSAPGPLLTWLFNRVIAPRGDRIVVGSLIKGLQGDDVPGGVRESNVTPGPIPCSQWTETYEPLPAEAVGMLRERADEAAQLALPALRRILCESALGGLGVKDFFLEAGKGLSGKELVHTTYFDSDAVLTLIAAHIQMASAGPAGTPKAEQLSGDREWVRRFKTTVEDTLLARLPPLETDPRRVLLRTRRFGGGPIFVRTRHSE
jgi:hypothetical protein